MALSPADLTQIISLIAAQLAAARVKISALPTVGAVTREAIFPIVDEGSTQKIPLSVLLKLGVSTVPVGQSLRDMDVTTIPDGALFYIEGVDTENDGGEGAWYYDANSVASDNIGTVIAPDSGVGRFLRQFNGSLLNVKWFEAKGDGVTDDTTAINLTIQTAIAMGMTGVFFPAGTYLYSASIAVRSSHIALFGSGSGVTTLKRKTGSASCNGIELGNLADGNAATAYTDLSVFGFTIDGNKAGVAQPADDLTDWGFSMTKISNSFFGDIKAINCWNGGGGVFINSNYNIGSMSVENCGEGYTGPVHEPGFDINSSKYNIFNVVSKDCYFGARVLDNCWGNICNFTVHNATAQGCVYNNQTVNESHSNDITVSVYAGCSVCGMSIGENCRNSTINLTVDEISGTGIIEQTAALAANAPQGNTYNIVSRKCGLSSCFIGSDSNTWNISTTLDGRTGAQGNSFAVEVEGSNNTLSVNLIDSAVWQVRGIVFRNGANDNTVASYRYTNTADPYNDGGGGLRNLLNPGVGMGAAIASSAEISIPILGDCFSVTGTTGITSMVANRRGRFTLIFTGILTVTDGSNLKLAGDFVTSADDTLTLVSDGTTCFEVARSTN